jgi:phosphopantetheine adenylyltransferase
MALAMGAGNDASFANYGLSIYLKYGDIIKCTLHMHDRNINIEYYKGNNHKVVQEPEIVTLAKQAVAQYQKQNQSGTRNLLVQIYRSVKSNPQQLKNVSDFESLGKAFLFMIDQKLSDDIDTLQMMASVGYLCISKAILQNSHNLNLYKDRLLIMKFGHEPLVYTVMQALYEPLTGNFSGYTLCTSMRPLEARDDIFKMEIADLELHPQLYQQVPLFRIMKDDFDKKIRREFFKPEKTLDNVIKSGIESHKKLLEYLENRIIEKGDVDF